MAGLQLETGTLGNSVAVSAANPVPVATTGANGTAAASNTNPAPVAVIGGTSVSRIVSAAASTNATVAKASAGVVAQVSGYNANAAARYLKFYNKATAPTVGTDVPVWTEYLAPQSKFNFSMNQNFATGIGYALTTGTADNDTGALTAGDVLALNVSYR